DQSRSHLHRCGQSHRQRHPRTGEPAVQRTVQRQLDRRDAAGRNSRPAGEHRHARHHGRLRADRPGLALLHLAARGSCRASLRRDGSGQRCPAAAFDRRGHLGRALHRAILSGGGMRADRGDHAPGGRTGAGGRCRAAVAVLRPLCRGLPVAPLTRSLARTPRALYQLTNTVPGFISPVSQPVPTLLEETRAALAGSWRLVAGRRDAPGYFSTDMRGLVSSFIALLISVAITFLASGVVAPAGAEISTFAALLQNALSYAGIMAPTWVIFNLLGFAGRFVAFVTVENWLTAFVNLAVTGAALFSGNTLLTVIVAAAGVITLVARINNGRLVV